MSGGPRPGPGLSATDRALAWLVTGPFGRVAAFFGDLGAYWYAWARRRLRGERR